MALVYLLYLVAVNCFWQYARRVYCLQLLFINPTSGATGRLEQRLRTSAESV